MVCDAAQIENALDIWRLTLALAKFVYNIVCLTLSAMEPLNLIDSWGAQSARTQFKGSIVV